MSEIQEKLKLLPDDPGVYIMLNKDGNVIYVGKARVLKNRVRQYFHSSLKTEKVAAMVANIADFYYIITKSEIDALSLENNLIKKYKPKYNILLKDDKTYPYIKVSVSEKFPSFTVTRKLKKGSRYFGPYMGGVRVRDVLEIVNMAYGVRTCYTPVGEKPKKPCLNYHIHRCPAPCAHLISEEEYGERVKAAMRFLDGDEGNVEALLKEKMNAYAAAEEFELAIDCRNKLEMLSKIALKRITALNRDINADVIAYVSNKLYSAVNILITRRGIMQGASTFAVENASSDGEALTSFISQYYANHQLPDELIVQDFAESALLEEFFRQTYSKAVSVLTPKQGVRRQLLDMAENNAAEYLEKAIDRIRHKEDMTVNACLHLQEELGLSRYPRRMECYDISNISGVDKVGSMVVFIDGEADRSQYRRFRIKTVEGADDFASLREVLRRRLAKLGTEEEEHFPKPDLVIIDGGKGQLSAVKGIFDEAGVSGIDLISLAKREEEVFTVGSREGILLDKRDYSLKMLQRIRDEAHRFAITFFRSIHSKRSLTSVLAEIPGVGKIKRRALIEKFGTIDRIMRASPKELAETEGIGDGLAAAIRKYFEEEL
ncbi:MAG TPA: excinuclease ABC subunit UvrC [Candidatus Borkfalkia avicola]|uniref:UvrABC system protein C n=1 Tax=Candidatus Borkfalkia avicola TaxID=2838503 RepID=A0A9D2IH92_9FIRM|nr:excinuclease ABC subunit UvrC [Candidatus Borkfalkia avicola]